MIINKTVKGGGSGENKLPSVVDGTVTEITAEDLDGATNIRPYAFYKQSSLESIFLSNTVSSIGDYAFQECTNLLTVGINEGAKDIGTSAFQTCSKLRDVIAPDSLEMIGKNAFASCPALVYTEYNGGQYLGNSENPYVVLMKGTATSGIHPQTKVIYYHAFYNLSALTSIEIPYGVKGICAEAFYGCGLTSLVVPDSVVRIEDGAFHGCPLASITLPFIGAKAGVTKNDLPQYPFGYVFGTTYVSSGAYACEQNYHKDSLTSTTGNRYYIPSALTSITINSGDLLTGALQNLSTLRTINLPFGMSTIEERALSGCKFEEFSIPNTVTNIGMYAFTNCTSMKKIVLPDSLSSLGTYAFNYCTGLVELEIGDGLATIQKSAFNACSGLTDVTVGTGVRTIQQNAFSGCTSLKNIYIKDFDKWCSATGKQYFLGYGSQGKEYYLNGSELVNVTMPELSNIGTNTFRDSVSIQTIKFTKKPSSIDSNAFYNCSSVTDIYVPWAQGAVANAPWGATNATIHYNWTPTPTPSGFTVTIQGESYMDEDFPDNCYYKANGTVSRTDYDGYVDSSGTVHGLSTLTDVDTISFLTDSQYGSYVDNEFVNGITHHSGSLSFVSRNGHVATVKVNEDQTITVVGTWD